MQSRLPWSRVVSKPHSCERKVQRRILIVDDDVDFAASLADLLEPRGYEVTTACEPEQALQLLSTSDPSIVMVDIRLSRHSGVEFLPRLLAARPELICIMITAYGDMGTAISALRRGAYDYYEKSSDPAELYAIMDRAFEKCELRRHTRETEQKLQEHKRQLDTALNNMSHGLCMFDVEARLVLCNERYREMYGLSPDAVKSGISLLDLLERRKTEGNFSEDPAQYGCDLLATLAQGKTASYVTKVGIGREVLI